MTDNARAAIIYELPCLNKAFIFLNTNFIAIGAAILFFNGILN